MNKNNVGGKSLFEKLADNEIPSWKICENEAHMAFLTPFPNTPGQTVVAPKKNIGDDAFELSDQEYQELLLFSKKVVEQLKSALKVKRVAMVVEGTGVAHVHVKLYPLHGKLAGRTDMWTSHQEFYPEYIGYITTVEGPKISDKKLDEIQQKILKAAEAV